MHSPTPAASSVQGTTPATLNYSPPGYPPYPASLCTSVNHEVCHGIPAERPLKNGDIVNIDVTVIKDGYRPGHNSRTFVFGQGRIRRLIVRRGCNKSKRRPPQGDLLVSDATYAPCHRA